MDLSKYTKVEHEDGRIEFIPIKKESEYLTIKEAAELQKESNPFAFIGGNMLVGSSGVNMLVGSSGVNSIINLDVNLNDDKSSEEPFKLFIGGDYNLEYVKETPAGAKQYIFKKKKK